MVSNDIELTLIMLSVKSANDKLMIFFFIFLKIGFDISCKLSSQETICMKYQIQFSMRNKKHILKCHLLKLLPGMQSVKMEA